jgi:TP53 regulating kinase and related kinases
MTRNELKIIKKIGKGKSGISFLAESPIGLVVLKEMHNEFIPYYQFNKNKVELELESYDLLSKFDFHIPKLIDYDIQKNYLIKEYIEGQTVTEKLIEAPLEDELILKVLQLELMLKKDNVNIDYFPSNFVIQDNTFFYIDYEHDPYSDEWNFSNWGIYYWLNREGMTNYMRTNDLSCINTPGTGKPLLTDKLENVRNSLIQHFHNTSLKH